MIYSNDKKASFKMNLKFKYILIVVLFFSTTINAQNLKSIYKNIVKEDYNDVQAEYNKSNNEFNNEEKILLELSKCILYSKSKYQSFKPREAFNIYKSISIINLSQNEQTNINEFLSKYTYTITGIYDTIIKGVFLESKTLNTIESYDEAIQICNDCKYKIELQNLKEVSAYKQAVNYGNVEILEQFLINYPTSKLTDEIEGLLHTKAFERATLINTVTSMNEYIERYTKSILISNAYRYRDSLVLSITPKDYYSLLKFVNTYPNSVYSNLIKKDLANLLYKESIDSNDYFKLDEFIRVYPNDFRVENVKNQLYKIKYYEINLKKFKKNNDEECDLKIKNTDKLLGKIEVMKPNIMDSVWIIDTLKNLKIYPYHYNDSGYDYLSDESYIITSYNSIKNKDLRGVINVFYNVPDSIIIIPTIYDMIESYNDLFIVTLNKGGDIYKKGVYKVISGKAKLITPIKYEEISIYNKLLLVQLNGKQGLIDLNGNLLTDINYDDIGTWNEGDESCNCLNFEINILEVLKNGKKGLIDSTGKLITPLIYDETQSFSEGLIGVRVKDKWSFIDEKGNTIIPFQSYLPNVNNENNLPLINDVKIHNFKNGLSIINHQDKFGLINKQGEIIFPCRLDYVKIHANGNSLIKINGKYGLINNKGDIIIPVIYESLFINEGLEESQNKTLVEATLNKKRGVLNEFGKIIIPFIYESISIDWKGYYIVGNNHKFGLLNKFGKVITPFEFESIFDFNFLKLVKVQLNGKYGLLNEFGIPITKFIYDEIDEFSKDGYAEVRIDKKKGLIDCKGNLITQIKYDDITSIYYDRDSVYYFKKGSCIATLNNKEVLINKLGKEVTDIKYNGISFEANNTIKVRIDDKSMRDRDTKFGLIDAGGKEITPIIYRKIDCPKFIGHLIRVELNDKFGLINSKGKEIVPIKYDELIEMDSINKLIITSLNRKIGCVNFSGKEVLPFIYDEIKFTNNKSKFLVEINGKNGVVDINGEIIIPPIYNEIVEISDSKFFAFQDCELKILNLTRYN
jgi:hypothetical protein